MLVRPVAGTVGIVEELASGTLFRFADWPSDLVPRRAAGVYTVWRDEEFVYAGMSGRGAQREDFVANSGGPSQAKGLWTRLTCMPPVGDPGTSSMSTSATGSSCPA
jgi:hypothetical protein